MSDPKPEQAPPIPEMFADEGLELHAVEGLKNIDTLIHEKPERAKDIIALYSVNVEVGDRWAELLADEDTSTRYPFRLTSALGNVASRQTLRYIYYDDATEKVIAADQKVQDIRKETRDGSKEHKEAATLTMAYLRLSIYAGELATRTPTRQTELQPASEVASA